ncbi:hypothetical protein M1432_00820 [Patescibacteria group bacterium]|nr:hypothetical protein [Patescibacteria group bacterium]
MAALCLNCGLAQAQTEDTVVIRAKYHLEITNLSFFSGVLVWLGRRVGVVPDTLEYRETDVVPAGKDDAFDMSLCDRSGKIWLQVFSDTSRPSFIDPPRFPLQDLKKAAFGADVIRFVAGIRDFFHGDSLDSFHDRFFLWKKTIDFSVARDSVHPLLYKISSVDSSGEPYILGSVLVSCSGGLTIYPWMKLDLLKAGATVILEMDRLEITRK